MEISSINNIGVTLTAIGIDTLESKMAEESNPLSQHNGVNYSCSATCAGQN
jgi:hypothetical protein